MCLILVAWRAHPDYPLVLAANRDELHARPTAPATWWEHPPILAGRDLLAGGTWLAVTRDGRFAALTNYRDPLRQRTDAPSRGSLVPDTLAAGLTAAEQLRALHATARPYNGFNLLFCDGAQLAAYESVPDRGVLLAPGVYGLSNHLLDTPWPKVIAAKAALSAALTHLPDRTALLGLLRDESQAPEEQLPRTGLSPDWEGLLSSAFVRAPDYGTRCSSILLCDRHGRVSFDEWSWSAAGELEGQRTYSFQLEPHG